MSLLRVSCLFSNFNANNFVFFRPLWQLLPRLPSRLPSCLPGTAATTPVGKGVSYVIIRATSSCRCYAPCSAPALLLSSPLLLPFAFCVLPCLFIKHICFLIPLHTRLNPCPFSPLSPFSQLSLGENGLLHNKFLRHPLCLLPIFITINCN